MNVSRWLTISLYNFLFHSILLTKLSLAQSHSKYLKCKRDRFNFTTGYNINYQKTYLFLIFLILFNYRERFFLGFLHFSRNFPFPSRLAQFLLDFSWVEKKNTSVFSRHTLSKFYIFFSSYTKTQLGKFLAGEIVYTYRCFLTGAS